MYNMKQLKYIKALTPIHAGAGQGLEIVDMPIQRERHSNIPKIEASSLKGSIKHWIFQKLNSGEFDKTKFEEMLGPKDGENGASRLGFTDARLLFFPIKSDEDIFKLITCPYILNRWIEDMIFSNSIEKGFEIPKVADGHCIKNENKDNKENKLFLEEYLFKVVEDYDNVIDKISNYTNSLGVDKNRIVIINDSEFIDLVSMYTEIVTRNRIDLDKGTADSDNGALFTEEYLPAETIMYFTVLAAPKFIAQNNEISLEDSSDNAIEYFNSSLGDVFQVGGDATIGKGFVKISGGVKNEKSKGK